MLKRIITGAVMTAVLVPVLIFSGTPALPALCAFLSCVASFEMLRCTGLAKCFTALIVNCAVAGLLPFGAYFGLSPEVLFLGLAVMFAADILSALFSRGRADVTAMCTAFAMTAYSTFGFTSLVFIRGFGEGRFLVFLPFIISWMTDTFAYFCGMAFGRHKLIPDVSPKKTVEGAVGGTLCATAITVGAFCIYYAVSGVRPNIAAVLAAALIGSLLSQCGDLIMSLVKRKYGIKDYGRMFPGHGGVLDRFDSVVMVSSFLCLMHVVFSVFPFMTLFAGV